MDKLIIKGNEIKEPGLFGKTVYVIKGNEIREPGLFGKTVYIINGNQIKEPGFFGKVLYVIDGEKIKKKTASGFFASIIESAEEAGKKSREKPTKDVQIHYVTDSQEQPSQTDSEQEAKQTELDDNTAKNDQTQGAQSPTTSEEDKKLLLILGAIAIAMFLTAIFCFSQLSSIWYLILLNGIESSSDFVIAIIFTIFKLLISAGLLVLEIFLFRKYYKKRKK